MLQGFLRPRRRQVHLRQAAGVTMVERVKKRSAKAGLPPGTLVHIGTKKVGETRIRILDYDENSVREKQKGRPGRVPAFSRHRLGDLDRHRGLAGHRAAGGPGRLLRAASPDPGGHPQHRPAPQGRRHGKLYLCRAQDARLRPGQPGDRLRAGQHRLRPQLRDLLPGGARGRPLRAGARAHPQRQGAHPRNGPRLPGLFACSTPSSTTISSSWKNSPSASRCSRRSWSAIPGPRPCSRSTT